jgi:hypothetical protein
MIMQPKTDWFFNDNDYQDDRYRPLEKMNPRREGAMPTSSHRGRRIGAYRKGEGRLGRFTTAATVGNMHYRRRKKVLLAPEAIARS